VAIKKAPCAQHSSLSFISQGHSHRVHNRNGDIIKKSGQIMAASLYNPSAQIGIDYDIFRAITYQ
jgi:hypothetical protein